MSKIELQFAPAKETKGTFKFDEVVKADAEPKVGTLYVRKTTLDALGWGENTASTLLVTIELPA